MSTPPSTQPPSTSPSPPSPQPPPSIKRLRLYASHVKWLADQSEKPIEDPELRQFFVTEVAFLASLLNVEATDDSFGADNRDIMTKLSKILGTSCDNFSKAQPGAWK